VIYVFELRLAGADPFAVGRLDPRLAALHGDPAGDIRVGCKGELRYADCAVQATSLEEAVERASASLAAALPGLEIAGLGDWEEHWA
jgi:hypothetical protein